MRLIRGKTSQKNTLESERTRLEEIIYANNIVIRYLYDTIMFSNLDESLYRKIHNLSYDFIMPDLHDDLAVSFPIQKRKFREEEYDGLLFALCFDLEDIAENEYHVKSDDLVSISQNLYDQFLDLYPNPNHFVEDYDRFRQLQLDGTEKKSGLFWLGLIITNSYYMRYYHKLNQAKDILDAAIKSKDFVLARQTMMEIERGINAK